MNFIEKWFYKKMLPGFESYQREQQKPIGKIYCGWFHGLSTAGMCPITTSFGPGQRVFIDFYDINLVDIEEMKRDKIKIRGYWYLIDDIIFNDDPPKKREEIINRYQIEILENMENLNWVKKCEDKIRSKY